MQQRLRSLWLALSLCAGQLACEGQVRHPQRNIEFDVEVPLSRVCELLGSSVQKQQVGATTSCLGFFVSRSVTGTFSRGPLSVTLGQLYSVTAYASTEIAGGQVNSIETTVDASTLSTHAQAHAAVEKLIAQFQHGKWQRYIPDTCPRVTGRSTLLDVTGKVSMGACPLDPALVLTEQEWPELASQKLRWQWIGDGRVATLEASYQYYKPLVPTYTINLQFELLEATKFYAAKRLKELQAEFGEARVAAGAANGATRIKQLEEAALMRGDSVLRRP